MGRLLFIGLWVLASSPAAAFVLPDLSFDDVDSIVVPLLEEGVVGVEAGVEFATLDCDCIGRAEGGDDTTFAAGLYYDKALRKNVAWRIGLRLGQRALSYRVAGADGEPEGPDIRVEMTYARLMAGLGLYFSPSDYVTLLIGLGGFANVLLDVDGEVGGRSSAFDQTPWDFDRGEAGFTVGLMLLFSPGRGRHWLWSLGAWFDGGLSDVGDWPRVDDDSARTQSLTGNLGVHF